MNSQSNYTNGVYVMWLLPLNI